MARTNVQIQTLMSLFIRIEKGELRVPSFQRDFVWSKKNIISFFEAIYQGFPIGPIYLVRFNDKHFQSHAIDRKSPKNSKIENVLYVIDGVQRLTALYNCLFIDSSDKEDIFNVGFNLEKRKFEHLKANPTSDIVVDLTSIFSSSKFMNDQEKILRHKHAPELMREMNNLYSIFVEYATPVFYIEEVDTKGVLEIFQTLNTKGVKLSKEDLLKANRKL